MELGQPLLPGVVVGPGGPVDVGVLGLVLDVGVLGLVLEGRSHHHCLVICCPLLVAVIWVPLICVTV